MRDYSRLKIQEQRFRSRSDAVSHLRQTPQLRIGEGKHFVPIVLGSASLFLIKKKKAMFFMGLGLISRETKEGGRIIVEIDGKVAKIRNLKVSLNLSSFFSPLRGLYHYRASEVKVCMCICLERKRGRALTNHQTNIKSRKEVQGMLLLQLKFHQIGCSCFGNEAVASLKVNTRDVWEGRHGQLKSCWAQSMCILNSPEH